MKTFDFELTLQSDAKLYCRAYCNARWEPEEYDVFRNDADRQEEIKSIYEVLNEAACGEVEDAMYRMANDVNYNTVMGMDVMTYAKGEL